jgi:hypothetical protein
MNRFKFLLLLVTVLVVFLIGCSQPERPTPTLTAPSTDALPTATRGTAAPTATDIILPTLLPTRTAAPSPSPSATVPPEATATATEAPDFGAVAVELHYNIPGLSLDRRVTGTVGGEITVVDETTGETVVRPNQGGIVTELQQNLPAITLAELPDDCPNCVFFEYELPTLEVSASGWLTDTRALASIENFTAAVLGPHFPAGTIIGLRRNASPYKAAHTIALTADGQLWSWLANDQEVEGPQPAGAAGEALLAALAAIPLEEVGEAYMADCGEGIPLETLYLNPDGEGEGKAVRVRCPNLALSSTLLPLYLELDSLLEPLLVEEGLAEPEANVPLGTLIHYRRGDGARLTLLQDGSAVLFSGGEEPITATVDLSSVGSVNVISLTATLLESDLLRPGIATLTTTVAANYLIVRAEDGIYTAGWDDGQADEALQAVLEALDELLEGVVAAPPEEEGGTPTAEPEEDTTATPVATPSPTPTPTRTPTPTP